MILNIIGWLILAYAGITYLAVVLDGFWPTTPTLEDREREAVKKMLEQRGIV